jgi:uncharacterized protein (DUF983 family)
VVDARDARSGDGRILHVVRLFGRGLLLRCPRCGRAPVLSGWFTVRAACAACGLRFDRGEPGYFVGAGCLNLIVAELVFAAGVLVLLGLTWPEPPWNAMLYGGIVAMVLTPIVFFPLSRTIWIAFDLAFRPAEPRDDVASDDGTGPER